MSNVLNKTTLEYLYNVNTPDYSTEDWIINPDLTSVSGVDETYWTVSGDNILEMTEEQKDTVDLDGLPTLKTTRFVEIDTHTQELVSLGFTYSGLQFSMSATAQAQMMGLHQIKDDPALSYPITWANIDNSDSYELVNTDDVNAFYLTGLGTYRYHADQGNSLKVQIREETTVSGVNAIIDNR